jgi:hypothetical protein
MGGPIPEAANESSRITRPIRLLTSAALFGGVMIVCGWLIYRAVNPADINHLVLIRQDAADYVLPFEAALVGDVTWKQPLVFYGRYRQGPGEVAIGVADIQRAWFNGKISIFDHEGKELATVEIHPPGRYCGALVVLVDAQGDASAAWNEMPNDESDGR